MPPPIARLDRDVLWLIFSLNADMFSPLEYDWEENENVTGQLALDTTLISSRVCGSWRDILLNSPSIWGKIIRLDRLYQLEKHGREEILKRTADAPLYILGFVPFTYDEFGSTFFKPLLNNNWPRIRRVHIRIDHASEEFPNLCLFPAPSLVSFNVHINCIYFQPFSESDVLFSKDAPLLQELGIHSSDFFLNLRVPWITHLRVLKLNTPDVDPLEIFNAIRKMPLLQELNLADIPGHSDLKSLDSEAIILPHLINLRVHGDFELAAALTRAIKPAAPCSLSFDSTITQDSVNLADITALLARYGEPYFAFWKEPSLSITLTDDSFLFAVPQVGELRQLPPGAAHNSGPGIPPEFRIRLTSSTPVFEDSNPFIAMFLKYDLSAVRVLNLGLDDSIPFTNINPLLQFLSRVEVLQISPIGLLSLVQRMDSWVEMDPASTIHASLPNLHTLQFRLFNFNKRSLGLRLLDFYQFRKDHRLSLPILDLGKNPMAADFAFLEAMTGLRVVWEVNGKQSEYMCGSGNWWKLRFRSLMIKIHG
ncbi:hypothetical protein CPB84DRAFT_1785803 [Gymnopilus junonius]|uniref:F-box domain-containing protein n=1 Tax=Gymnopilus junonius TaxID=109634 RepID=A0A9P5NJJ9_GYMJU|nr:hypothetical protein CPB84DRAFT_1785803 [Gymnopilus junonius]